MKNRLINFSYPLILCSFFYAFWQRYFIYDLNDAYDLELIIGTSANLPARWVGTRDVEKNIPILILAGHADSQGLSGAGTSGEAVDKFGLHPMDPEISDELFWNLKLQESIVQLGKVRGLNIRSYDPGIRNIDDADDPRTNWSIGKKFSQNRGYSIEIHFDSYGDYGFFSDLILLFFEKPNKIDDSIVRKFARFLVLFKGGLVALRRQIRILEIGKISRFT